jgi:hypothetical protein
MVAPNIRIYGLPLGLARKLQKTALDLQYSKTWKFSMLYELCPELSSIRRPVGVSEW